MAKKEICIIGQKDDYFFIVDSSKRYAGKIHKSIVQDNKLAVIDGKINVSDSMYREWFKEDVSNEIDKIRSEYEKSHANKFFVLFDYPINSDGLGFNIEFFSENEEIAKARALEIYKKQFGEAATGKMIKFVRYRWFSEVRRFCFEKYGTSFPDEVEYGQIKWLNVPYFVLAYTPMQMKMMPYLIIDEHSSRRLTPEQLALLGINFDPYEHTLQDRAAIRVLN